jgi:hypothetical protein
VVSEEAVELDRHTCGRHDDRYMIMYYEESRPSNGPALDCHNRCFKG